MEYYCVKEISLKQIQVEGYYIFERVFDRVLIFMLQMRLIVGIFGLLVLGYGFFYFDSLWYI